MPFCSGKHCAWCEICLGDNEIITCDSCRYQIVTDKLFTEIVANA